MVLGRNGNPRRGGVFTTLLVLLALFIAFGVLCWILLLPTAVTKYISSRTGFAVKVESLSVNPLTAKVVVRGLVIENPADFPVKDFVQLREFRADAELGSLFGDKLIVDEAVVDVAQVALVKNKQGQSNGVLFKDRLQGPTKPEPAAAEPSGKKKEFLIRKLDLRFDTLLIVDGTGSKPSTRRVDINFKHSYTDVTSPVQIAMPIVGRVAALGGSIGDFAGKLGPEALDAAKKTGEALRDAGKKAGETLKDIFQSIKDKATK